MSFPIDHKRNLYPQVFPRINVSFLVSSSNPWPEWQKAKMVDEATKKSLSSIPLLKTKAGPRDKDLWVQRLKEEYQALIQVEPL